MTMKERMLGGKMYNSMGEELTKMRTICSLEFLPQVNGTMGDNTKSVCCILLLVSCEDL